MNSSCSFLRFPLRMIAIWLPLLSWMAACSVLTEYQSEAPPTLTSFPFMTATDQPSPTPVTPTATFPPTATIFIPTHTPTIRPTLTHTPTATETPRGRQQPTPTQVSGCVGPPKGVFLEVYLSDPSLPEIMGCPTSPPGSGDPPDTWEVSSIYQPFERGHMLWLSNVGWFEAKVIYVLLDDQTYERYDDDYDPDVDPESGGFRPPTGLYEPVAALGKLWREEPGLDDRLGFGLTLPIEAMTEMQMFTYGEMVHIPGIVGVFVFKRGPVNTWLFYSLQVDDDS